MKQLKVVVAAKGSASLVVCGDFNMRLDEERALLSAGHFEDAEYAGDSWDMRKNKYFEEYKGQGRAAPAYSFDRIFYGMFHTLLDQSYSIKATRISKTARTSLVFPG